MRDREQALMSHYDNLDYYSPLDRTDFTGLLALVDCVLPVGVLDVGCGDGRLRSHLPLGTEYVGVDYNERRAAAAGAVCADLYGFLAGESGWPMVVLVEVLEHLEEPLKAVALARSAGDVVVATVPVNMPYEAHLSVFESVDAAVTFFEPDVFAPVGGHVVMKWGQ